MTSFTTDQNAFPAFPLFLDAIPFMGPEYMQEVPLLPTSFPTLDKEPSFTVPTKDLGNFAVPAMDLDAIEFTAPQAPPTQSQSQSLVTEEPQPQPEVPELVD